MGKEEESESQTRGNPQDDTRDNDAGDSAQQTRAPGINEKGGMTTQSQHLPFRHHRERGRITQNRRKTSAHHLSE